MQESLLEHAKENRREETWNVFQRQKEAHIMTEVRVYACKGCGQNFSIVPPDDIHVIAISDWCKKGDSIEIPYDWKLSS